MDPLEKHRQQMLGMLANAKNLPQLAKMLVDGLTREIREVEAMQASSPPGTASNTTDSHSVAETVSTPQPTPASLPSATAEAGSGLAEQGSECAHIWQQGYSEEKDKERLARMFNTTMHMHPGLWICWRCGAVKLLGKIVARVAATTTSTSPRAESPRSVATPAMSSTGSASSESSDCAHRITHQVGNEHVCINCGQVVALAYAVHETREEIDRMTGGEG